VGWRLLIGVWVALLMVWVALVAFLLLARPGGSRLKEAARILPDTLRLPRRLAADRALPRGVRVRLWLLVAYLAVPIDLVPDFIPVIRYADDAIIVAAVLRSVVRRAGPDAVRDQWPGSEQGLAVLWRVAGLPGPPAVPDGQDQPFAGGGVVARTGWGKRWRVANETGLLVGAIVASFPRAITGCSSRTRTTGLFE
jgi:uncharacterized membrane protein YkvA (DUF1232 family)